MRRVSKRARKVRLVTIATPASVFECAPSRSPMLGCSDPSQPKFTLHLFFTPRQRVEVTGVCPGIVGTTGAGGRARRVGASQERAVGVDAPTAQGGPHGAGTRPISDRSAAAGSRQGVGGVGG